MIADRASAPGATCVLIVDDEEDVRESLRDVVEMMGCSALMASSAEEALALLDHQKPCLVVLDLLMPGMQGGELLDMIYQQPLLASLPVLISTSAPERAPRGVPLLAKPIDVHALCEWVQTNCRCS